MITPFWEITSILATVANERSMKMKLIKSAFPIFLLFLSVSAFAQQAGSVTGTLQDAQTKEPMAGAMVEIFPVSDSAARRYVTANAQGRFSVTGLPYREYAYNVTFLGYDTLAGSVKVNRAAVALGVLQMAQKARAGGARTVAITRYAKSPLAEYMDVVLLCGGYEPPLQEGSFPSKTAQLFVLDLLFTEVYRTQFDYSKEINKRVTTSILDKNY